MSLKASRLSAQQDPRSPPWETDEKNIMRKQVRQELCVQTCLFDAAEPEIFSHKCFFPVKSGRLHYPQCNSNGDSLVGDLVCCAT